MRPFALRLPSRALALLFAAVVAIGPANAGGGPRGAPSGNAPVTDETVRRAPAGTENLVVLVGGSPDGSAEERYSQEFQRRVGGRRLHGEYGVQALVDAIVSPDRKGKPIANLYICGHIVLVPLKALPDRRPARATDEYHGVLLVGKQAKDHALNLDDTFFDAFDRALEKRGMTPGDLFARNARVSFKVCLLAAYCRDFLDKLATRLPEGSIIEAYSVPFAWSTAFHIAWVSDVVGNFNEKFLFGEQAQGLVHLPGKWKPTAGTPPRPVPLARPEADPDFAGLER